MKTTHLVCSALLALSLHAHAADKVKIGFVSTLSGPLSALGIDIRDGFRLALKETGNKIGGLPAEVVEGDDQASPDVGKQIADRLLKRDKVDFMTWVADITYVPTSEGWLYLAAVMDLAGRRLVGRSMSETIDATLVCTALKSACGCASLPRGCWSTPTADPSTQAGATERWPPSWASRCP